MITMFPKSPRRLRKEKKKRLEERTKAKEQLVNMNKMFSTKESKVKNMKRIEKSKAFQTDLIKMKSLLINTKPFNVGNMDHMIKNYDQTKQTNKERMRMKNNNKDDFWRL